MKKKLLIFLVSALLISFCIISAQADGITINNHVTTTKGKTVVSWTDSNNNSPYQVAYEYYDGGSASQSGFWAGGSQSEATTNKKSYTFSELIPGHKYIITVFDKNDNWSREIIKVPEAKAFNDMGIKATTMSVDSECRYISADGQEKWPSVFILDQMLPYVKDKRASCGVSYKFEIPAISQMKKYTVLIAMYAPNGYAETVLVQDITFTKTSVFKTYYTTCTGSEFFRRLLEENGTIPVGKYTVEMYWDGMLVNRDHFSVKK